MPYQRTSKLPGERSSYISHLDLIQHEPVLKEILCLLKERSSSNISGEISWNECEGKIKEQKNLILLKQYTV